MNRYRPLALAFFLASVSALPTQAWSSGPESPLAAPMTLSPRQTNPDDEADRRGLLWVGSGLMYEFRLGPDQPFTASAGLGLFVKETSTYDGNSVSTSREFSVGPAVEGLYYFSKAKAGLALALRVGTVDGNGYVAPGVLYVSRSRSGGFRAGLYFPNGSNLEPVGLEIGYGFRL
jgi:hypothetical protein